MIELTIKRPNGEIEKVRREGGMTNVMFEKMQEATRNAGRGDILRWELVDDRTDEEKAAHILSNKIEKLENEIAKAHGTNNAWMVCKLEKQIAELRK